MTIYIAREFFKRAQLCPYPLGGHKWLIYGVTAQ